MPHKPPHPHLDPHLDPPHDPGPPLDPRDPATNPPLFTVRALKVTNTAEIDGSAQVQGNPVALAINQKQAMIAFTDGNGNVWGLRVDENGVPTATLIQSPPAP